MKVKVTKKPKATVEINIVVAKEKVKEAYEAVFKDVLESAEVKGFRKGQVPEEIVKEKTDVSKLYGDVVNKLLQTHYPQALKEKHIQPIANPKVEVKEFDLEKDFEFTATVAVEPEVKIGNYEKELKDLKVKKEAELKKLNAANLKEGKPLAGEHAHVTAEDIIFAIANSATIEVADILKADEADRMMSRLVNQAQTVGLSLEQYLKSQNKTADQLREEYLVMAEKNLRAEFALGKLIETEKITVTDEEVENAVTASQDPKAKEALNNPSEKLYIRSILAKNKLIAQILSKVDSSEKANTKETK